MTAKARISAINRFISGCKADGIYSDLRAACVMAGWDGLAGALTPLVGASPTNNGFLDADLDRGNGLTGDGSSKYLNSGRANNADPQNDKHLAVYISAVSSATGAIRWALGDSGTSIIGQLATNEYYLRANDADATVVGSATPELGFVGVSRAAPETKGIRLGGTTHPVNAASIEPSGSATFVFRRNDPGNFGAYDGTLTFYSIGTSLDLALLDSHITNYVTAIGASI